MTKLKLTLDALRVESFPTGDADGLIGTVQARELIPTPPYLTCGCILKTKPTDCPCTP